MLGTRFKPRHYRRSLPGLFGAQHSGRIGIGVLRCYLAFGKDEDDSPRTSEPLSLAEPCIQHGGLRQPFSVLLESLLGFTDYRSCYSESCQPAAALSGSPWK